MSDKEIREELNSVHQPLYDTTIMLLNCVPTVGPAVAYLAGRAIPDPGRVALESFLVKLASRVQALEAEGLSIREVLERPQTPPLLSHAFNIASRAFGEKKVDALRNATINGIFYRPENVSLTAIVFGMLDRLTDAHISLLMHLHDREKKTGYHTPWSEARMSGVTFHASENGLYKPQLTLESTFYDERDIEVNEILLSDLETLGLIGKEIPFASKPLDEWPDSSDNSNIFVAITAKGQMTLEHITEAQSPADEAAGLP